MSARIVGGLLVLGVLAGCAPEPTPTTAAWLRSWSFDWTLANHRVSFLAARPTATGVEGGFVGGASTTGRTFDDSDACLDPTTCWELPGFDPGIVTAQRVQATSSSTVLASARGAFEVGAGGLDTRIEVPLPRAAEGQATAWIAGFAWSSAPDLAGDFVGSCYDARHGWLPTRMSVTLGEVTVDGDVATVPVSLAFTAGLSRESQRVCLDAVVSEATMGLELDVAVAVGDTEATRLPVNQGASWPVIGEDQEIGDVGSLALALPESGGLVGWSALDLRFQIQVDPGRGAYLRTLQTELSPDDGLAYTFVANPSFTQLEGFDYAFAGEVVSVPFDGDLVVTEHGDDALAAELDADGRPVFHELQLVP